MTRARKPLTLAAVPLLAVMSTACVDPVEYLIPINHTFASGLWSEAAALIGGSVIGAAGGNP